MSSASRCEALKRRELDAAATPGRAFEPFVSLEIVRASD
jgi:hypothetical protein